MYLNSTFAFWSFSLNMATNTSTKHGFSVFFYSVCDALCYEFGLNSLETSKNHGEHAPDYNGLSKNFQPKHSKSHRLQMTVRSYLIINKKSGYF